MLRFGSKRRARELFGDAGTPSVAIIGGGLGGIGVAVRLKRAGISAFTIFDENDGPGGTWWENHYPGCECDSEAYSYSYSFKSHDWSRNFATQAELLRYIEEVVDEYGLRSHFRFETLVEEVVLDESTHMYTVRVASGEESRFHVVVSAVGLLNYLNRPNWPGLEDFEGPNFPPARWEHEHDLRGKRVAVVGTGSTGAQVVGAIAPIVGHLYVFQREPGHVLPKRARDFTPRERNALRRPLGRRFERIRCYKRSARLRSSKAPLPGSRVNRWFEGRALNHIREVFADRPDLAELVTPRYPFFGKRPLMCDDFYPALLRDNVELVPRGVERVTPTGVVDSDGVEREIDVLVIATGFQAANYLASFELVGRGGVTIHEAWNGEPRAFLGMTVAGFPNFYMVLGPSTNGAETFFLEEQEAAYIVRAVKRMTREGVTSIEVRKDAMDRFNRWLQRRLRGSSFGRSEVGYKLGYYRSPTGTIVTQWNQGLTLYWLMCRTLGRISSVTAVAKSPAHIPESKEMVAPVP